MSYFSIIMPVYNAGEYLKICLDSILHQSFTDYELVIVDDESTDSSYEIAREYAEKNGKIKVERIKHVPVGDVRNTAIDISSGKYLIFIDADDSIDKDYLKNIHKATSEVSPDICFMPNHFMDKENGISNHDFIINCKENWFWDNKIDFLNYIRTNNGVIPAAMWTVACSRKMVCDLGITMDSNYIWSQDTDYIFKSLSSAKNVAVCAYRGYYWNRKNVNSATSNFSARKVISRLSVYKKWYDKLDEYCFGNVDKNVTCYLKESLLKNYCEVLFIYSFVKEKKDRDEIAEKFKKDGIWRQDKRLVFKDYYKYGLRAGRIIFLAKHYTKGLVKKITNRG